MWESAGRQQLHCRGDTSRRASKLYVGLRELEKAFNAEMLRGIYSDSQARNTASHQLSGQSRIDLSKCAYAAEGIDFDEIRILIFASSPRRLRRSSFVRRILRESTDPIVVSATHRIAELSGLNLSRVSILLLQSRVQTFSDY
jgi:hypothetical protein